MLLFTARETSWARPVPFAKVEFGINEDVYFSDGPSLFQSESGKLYMALSSWGDQGYAVGVAISDSGSILGPWRQQKKPLYPAEGGHGMFFRNIKGETLFTLHSPNDREREHPTFWRIQEDMEELCLNGSYAPT